jgi:hypothetical protein
MHQHLSYLVVALSIHTSTTFATAIRIVSSTPQAILQEPAFPKAEVTMYSLRGCETDATTRPPDTISVNPNTCFLRQNPNDRAGKLLHRQCVRQGHSTQRRQMLALIVQAIYHM